MIRIIVGTKVQMISRLVWWVKLVRRVFLFSRRKKKIIRASIQETKVTTRMRKNIRSWCRSTIFSIISVAGVWKFICHGVAASRRIASVGTRRDVTRVLG